MKHNLCYSSSRSYVLHYKKNVSLDVTFIKKSNISNNNKKTVMSRLNTFYSNYLVYRTIHLSTFYNQIDLHFFCNGHIGIIHFRITINKSPKCDIHVRQLLILKS